jgi:dihydrofolate synthase / folylpolyglutamate synthase
MPVHHPLREVTYAEAIQFVSSLQLFGAQFGLENTFRLAELAANPQNKLRFIHVAGTNGKGSTCAMLESIYGAAGLRVGLYTSPHLVSFRERIQVNRTLIPEQDITRLASEARRWLTEFPPDVHPTFFEVVTIMALRHFAEQKCDLVIWETGLGGRLDATNIVTPLASVITNVQFDHEKWLGSTIEEIAREKAGIIKPRVPVITAADGAALAVIRETAQRMIAPLHIVEAADTEHSVELRGEHQRLNAAVALATVKVLAGATPVPDGAIASGLGTLDWPARFQVIRRGLQTIVLDGAHNPAGADALVATLRAEAQGQPITLILGILEDKDWQHISRTLGAIAVRILLVPVASSRTAPPEKLVPICAGANPSAQVLMRHSLREALQTANDDPFILVTGSLYLVGEAMELLGLSTVASERALNEWTAPQR